MTDKANGIVVACITIVVVSFLLSSCIAPSQSGGDFSDHLMLGDSIITPHSKIVLLDVQVMIGNTLRARIGITWTNTGNYEEHLLSGTNSTKSEAYIKSPDQKILLQISQQEASVDWKDTSDKRKKSARLAVKETILE
jgi:hypothetical protein